MVDYMTPKRLEAIKGLLAIGEIRSFYSWEIWRKVRKEVLELDHGLCTKCKMRGITTPATKVHHSYHLRKYPTYALAIYTPYGKRNLYSLCDRCHQEEHPEEYAKFKGKYQR